MKKIVFLILLISICNCLLAQDTTKIEEKRNAVKGIVAIVPSFFNGIISLGYERYINSNSSLCLTLKGYATSGEDNLRISYSIIPNYNYYFSSKYKFINNICLNPCLIYTNTSYGFEDFEERTDNYGLGLSIGKRMYFSHKKRWFFDIGFGTAYFKTIYKYYKDSFMTWDPNTLMYEYITISSHDPTYSWYPRFIFLLGYKF